jgi:hypothetical protein
MRMLRTSFLVLSVILVAGLASGADRHVSAELHPVGGSGVTGRVELTAMHGGGTLITVVASGLQPGTQYTSLYYDNHTCELEPYSAEDVIGVYTANAAGRATVTGKADDDLDEINSVSVRLQSDFSLLSCADTHP